MIVQVNLLPPELRRRERTPLKAFVPFLACVAAITAVTAFWSWVHFGELDSARRIYDDLRAQVQVRKGPIAYLTALTAEETEYQERARTISKIAASRMIWTRKLDELTRVVTDDHNGQRYLVWLQSMDVKPPVAAAGRKTAEGEAVLIKGLCFAGTDGQENALQRYNQLHEATRQSDFFRGDFVSMANPAGKAEFLDDGLKPSSAWTIEIPMVMASRTVDPRKAAVVGDAKGNARR